MIEIDGMITSVLISILVDFESNFSYVNSNLVVKFHLESKLT